jgi:hypothetical protein
VIAIDEDAMVVEIFHRGETATPAVRLTAKWILNYSGQLLSTIDPEIHEYIPRYSI